MRHNRLTPAFVPLAALALLAASGCTDSPVSAPPETSLASTPAGSAGASSRASRGTPASSIWRVKLSPLNDSGVHGTATIEVRKGWLTVVLNAVGHEVGMEHAQHIHGPPEGGDGSCPTAADDTDGDGLVSIGEGLPFYGPVELPLTPFPLPTNQAGAISYKESFPVDGLSFDPADLGLKSMVLHGRTVEDGYVGSLPVACGTVEPVN